MEKRMFVYRSRCTGCIWNNKPRCGRDFCILPQCAAHKGLPRGSAARTAGSGVAQAGGYYSNAAND